MSPDAKVWSVILGLFLLVVASYYGTFKWGERVMLHRVANQLIEMTKLTYAEAYQDGIKQAQLDCMGGFNGHRTN